MKQLLASGANPSLCSKGGMTAVHLCAKYGRPDYLKLLVEEPGQLALTQKRELAEIIFVCTRLPTSHCFMLASFTIGNVNVDIKDGVGQSPLDIASSLVDSWNTSLPIEKMQKRMEVQTILLASTSLDR